MLNNIKALLIEDNKQHIDMIIDLLHESELTNVSMDISESLASAYQFFQKNRYDVILADLALPDSRYKETLKEIMKVIKDVPIIVITEIGDRDAIYGMIKAGASDCIPKSHLSTPILERSILYSMDRHKKDQTIKKKVFEIEVDLRNSEARFRTLINDVLDNSIVGIFIVDKDFKIVWANKTLELFFGINRDEIIGKNNRQIIKSMIMGVLYKPKDFAEKVLSSYDNNTYIDNFECHVMADGERDGRWLVYQSTLIRSGLYEGGRVEIYHDITERKKSEEQIKASLKEKDMLLVEIHHRVKNNMQVIASLLRLQSEGIKDKHLLDLFNESRNRIKSMALVHEDLYHNKNLANIAFDQYTRKLTGRLMKTFGVNPDRIITSINIDNVFLGVDKAIPCGLIINELFTNSLKYAFPHIITGVEHIPGKDQDRERSKNKGKICINLHSNNDEYTLVFSDNGVGLPENIDLQKDETLGLELVRTLVKQLKGTSKLNSNGGTEFKITFKV